MPDRDSPEAPATPDTPERPTVLVVELEGLLRSSREQQVRLRNALVGLLAVVDSQTTERKRLG